MSRPFPTSVPQFQTVFPDEQTCRKYLVESRWPDGFRCQRCGHEGAWGDGVRLVCRVCRHETTVTADTILHRSHRPLLTWFWSAYLVSTMPGLNALALGKALGNKSRRTSWNTMERLRRSMSSLDLPRLTGVVEADETAVGGYQPGKTGFSGANKTTVLVLVERGSGRTRLVVIPDRKGKTLVSLIAKLVEPGSTIITDGHVGYRGLTRAGYTWVRIPHPIGGLKRGGNRATPAADGAISLFKRWLIGTYNKPPKDLTRYLGEFCFRAEFRNQPEMAFSTLLGLAVKPIAPTLRPDLASSALTISNAHGKIRRDHRSSSAPRPAHRVQRVLAPARARVGHAS